jgi:hypothetical protein
MYILRKNIYIFIQATYEVALPQTIGKWIIVKTRLRTYLHTYVFKLHTRLCYFSLKHNMYICRTLIHNSCRLVIFEIMFSKFRTDSFSDSEVHFDFNCGTVEIPRNCCLWMHVSINILFLSFLKKLPDTVDISLRSFSDRIPPGCTVVVYNMIYSLAWILLLGNRYTKRRCKKTYLSKEYCVLH